MRRVLRLLLYRFVCTASEIHHRLCCLCRCPWMTRRQCKQASKPLPQAHRAFEASQISDFEDYRKSEFLLTHQHGPKKSRQDSKLVQLLWEPFLCAQNSTLTPSKRHWDILLERTPRPPHGPGFGKSQVIIKGIGTHRVGTKYKMSMHRNGCWDNVVLASNKNQE